MVEVPPDAQVKFVMRDRALLKTPEGVNPSSIRIQMNATQYVAGDAAIKTTELADPPDAVEVVFQPPGGFPRPPPSPC